MSCSRLKLGLVLRLLGIILAMDLSGIAKAKSDPLTIGDLASTATSNTITISLTRGLSGGSGTGYRYRVFRGETADFTPSEVNQIAETGNFPFVDSTAGEGTQFYKVVGIDDAGNVANAVPADLGNVPRTKPLVLLAAHETARSYPEALAPTGAKVLLVTLGDSISAGWQLGPNEGPAKVAQSILGLKPNVQSVLLYNPAIGGTTTRAWQPGGDRSFYQAMALATKDQLVAHPDYTPVFSIMFGANDASGNKYHGPSMEPSEYVGYVASLVSSLASDFPTAKIVVNCPIYFSPNLVETPEDSAEARLARLAKYSSAIRTTLSSLSGAMPGRVYLGDTFAFDEFARSYSTNYIAQLGDLGTFYLHPNAAGARKLGAYWADAIYSSLYSPMQITAASLSQTTVSLRAATLPSTETYAYQWYRSTTSNFDPSDANKLTGETTATLDQSGLAPGTTYHFALRRTSASGETTWSRISITTAAATFSIVGPIEGYVGKPATFQVSSNGPVYGRVVVTPSDGAGGTFKPATVTLVSPGSTTYTSFVYTPKVAGTRTITTSVVSDLAGQDATFYARVQPKSLSLSAPSVKTVIRGRSVAFTISALPVGSTLITPVTVTPTVSGVTGSFSPESLTLSSASPTATFTFTPDSVGLAAVTTANTGGLVNPASAKVTVVNVQVSSLSLSPTSVIGTVGVKGTFKLNIAAPEGGTTVSLLSSSPHLTVPSTVQVPEGALGGTFTATAQAVFTPSSATVTASTPASSLSATVALRAIVPTSITFTPSALVGGVSFKGTVKLNAAAPEGGATLALTSSDASVVVPASVTIPKGALSIGFTGTTLAVASPTTATIQAELAGTSVSSTLSLRPVSISTFTVAPATVKGGGTVNASVKLDALAGPGDVSVAITSDNAAAIPLSGVLVISRGVQSKAMAIKTLKVTTTTTVTISVTFNGLTLSKVLTITP